MCTMRSFIREQCWQDKKLAVTSTSVAFVMGMVMVMLGALTDAVSLGWAWWYVSSINGYDWDGFETLDELYTREDTGNT